MAMTLGIELHMHRIPMLVLLRVTGTFSLPSCAAPQSAARSSVTAGEGHKGRHGGSAVHRRGTASNVT